MSSALVRVKRENRGLAEGAGLAPFVRGADGLAGILDQHQIAGAANGLQLVHGARLAEDVNRKHGAGSPGDRARDQRRIDVERSLVDVDEHRCRPFIKNAIGRGDKAERRGDDFVAFGNAGGAHAQMQARRAIGDGYGVFGADVIGKVAFQLFDEWADAQPVAAQHACHQLDVFGLDVGRRQRDAMGWCGFHIETLHNGHC
jgi:hypothetical protein